MKIFAKYSLLMLCLLLLSAGTITLVSLIHHKKALTREALLRGESIATNLALVSAEAILTKNLLQLLPLSMDATTRHENVAYAAVADAKGQVLAHPDRTAMDKPFGFRSRREESGYGIQALILEGRGMGRELWDVSVPVKAKGSLVELGRVHVGLDRSTVERSVQDSLTQVLVIAATCLLLALGITFLAVRYMVRPLQQLSSASARVGEGDFGVRVAVTTRDEVGELASNFNAMVENLKVAEARKLEASRIESELHLAHDLQKSLLPRKAPELKNLELAWFYEPAKELGGDFYDWFELEGGKKLGFVVADVSGKGVPAALHMANLRNVIRFTSAKAAAPIDVLREVNALAFPDLRGETFVTLIYGLLELKSGMLSYVNAGHDPAFWRKASGDTVSLGATSLPVGAVDSDEFDPLLKEERIVLKPGDLFFLYTDGVTEAADPEGRQFGLERIKARLGGKTPVGIVEGLGRELEHHLKGYDPQDDVTMLAIKLKSPEKP